MLTHLSFVSVAERSKCLPPCKLSKFQRARRLLAHQEELAKLFLGERDEAEGDGLLLKVPAPSLLLEIIYCLVQ